MGLRSKNVTAEKIIYRRLNEVKMADVTELYKPTMKPAGAIKTNNMKETYQQRYVVHNAQKSIR
jgi:hypothetical protein